MSFMGADEAIPSFAVIAEFYGRKQIEVVEGYIRMDESERERQRTWLVNEESFTVGLGSPSHELRESSHVLDRRMYEVVQSV
jgi:hypothetical protein